MARRTVIFNDAGKNDNHMREHKASAGKNISVQKKQSVAREKTKIPVLNVPAIFSRAYFDDVKETYKRSCLMRDREEAPSHIRKYHNEKAAFLEQVIRIMEENNHGKYTFTAIMEPFFYNEWRRLLDIARQCNMKYSSTKKISPAWKKEVKEIANLLLPHYNALRSERDGYVCKGVPSGIENLVFDINGTMFYLEKQIANFPERNDLCDLKKMYDMVYWKSKLKHAGYRTAYLIKNRDKKVFWKNTETVEYLLRNHIPPQVIPENKATQSMSM